MADLSHWVAQACEYHDSEGTFKVIYFQNRQELITVGEELQSNEDSWSDDLFSSNMGSNVYKNQLVLRACIHSRFNPETSAPKLHTNFVKHTKNDIPKASMAKLLYLKGPPSQTMATSSSKNDIQEAKEKGKSMEYIKSIEPAGILHRVFKRLKKDHQVYPSQAYKTQDEHQDEGTSSLPTTLSNHMDSLTLEQVSFLHRFIQWLRKDHRVYPSPNIQGTSSLPKKLMDSWPALDDNPYRDAKPPGYCKYALVFGITTEYNPSGVWVIQELYNDIEESDF